MKEIFLGSHTLSQPVARRAAHLMRVIGELGSLITQCSDKVCGMKIVSEQDFQDAEFLSAAEKRIVLRHWKTFLAHGCAWKNFTKAIYDHLHLHCGFIAHYDRQGFYRTYWVDLGKDSEHYGLQHRTVPAVLRDTAKWFLTGFDIWGDYVDISSAMMNALHAELEAVRRDLLTELDACRSFELNHAQQLFEQMSEAKREDISELKAKLNRLEQELAADTVSLFTDTIARKYDEYLPPVREAVQLKLA